VVLPKLLPNIPKSSANTKSDTPHATLHLGQEGLKTPILPLKTRTEGNMVYTLANCRNPLPVGLVFGNHRDMGVFGIDYDFGCFRPCGFVWHMEIFWKWFCRFFG